MLLELEILDGVRKGQKIKLNSNLDTTDKIPYVLETEAIIFKLSLDQEVSGAKLVVGNTEINLLPTLGIKNEYIANPNRTERGGYESLFFNYLGIAIFYVQLEGEAISSFEEVGQIEVLARKASVEQVQSMINFIMTSEEDDLLSMKGPTNRSAVLEKKEGEKPQKLIEQLEENLRLLKLQLPYILNAPLSALSSKLQVRPGSPGVDTSDQGMAWLTENLSVLQPADAPDSATLEYQGEFYIAEEIQTSVVYENKDIYENRILHGYIDNLLRFTNKLLLGYDKARASTSLNHYEGYVSFFSAMSQWIKEKNSVHIKRVQNIQHEIRVIQKMLSQKIPIREIDLSLPRFTPKVRANRQYTILFRSIHDWYQGGYINWGNQKLLLAISNIPKLFELYSVLLTKKWCSLNCSEIIHDQNFFWRGYINGHSVKLHYEPEFWMSGHVKVTGDIVNTHNHNLHASVNDEKGKRRFHRYAKRSPDIVLEIEKKDGELLLVVLDAKYTTQKLAFERDLPMCIVKYVHGLGSWRNQHLVKAMIIVFPHKKGEYHDFHASPFDVNGITPQFPLLGVQGLNLSETSTDQNEYIHNLLSTIFRLIDE
ncbi:hypothetical protein [Vreelandella titanicae]|uniref:hypothetical protein n=1 Tax=Vreelandella titanicae TaxID=664683 RepID=UPI0039BF47ED